MTSTVVLADTEAPDSGLLGLLRRASSVIDSMWHTALVEGDADSAVQLGEASQGVHRALIALSGLDRGPLPS